MKKIEAMIRIEKLEAVREALEETGYPGMTIVRSVRCVNLPSRCGVVAELALRSRTPKGWKVFAFAGGVL